MKSKRMVSKVAIFFFCALSLGECIAKSLSYNFDKKPEAAKLTINIDSVSQALPPQIAYFIPDSFVNNFFNRSFFESRMNRTWQSTRSRNNNNGNVPDSIPSPQQNFRFVEVPQDRYRRVFYNNEDPITAYQNFNYDVDFSEIPDKAPNFRRFEQFKDRSASFVDYRKKANKQRKKYIKRPVNSEEHKYLNYNPLSLRNSIKYLKSHHKKEFQISEEDYPSSNRENIPVIKGVRIKTPKLRNHRYKQHAGAASSYENSAEPNYDMENLDVPITRNHKNCLLQTLMPGSYEQTLEVDNVANNQNNNRKRKRGKKEKELTFYITKIRNHNKSNERAFHVDPEDIENDSTSYFVPTTLLSSTRGVESMLRRPRKAASNPRIKERLRETGAHLVYTEDGYENREYDHGSEEKLMSYSNLNREKRDTGSQHSNLKGQELLDHLSILIENASYFLNDTDLRAIRKKYPFYNKANENLKDSSLKYSEYTNPKYNSNGTNSYYDSKTKKCNDVSSEVNISEDAVEAGHNKKRLNNLGDKINCLKEQLFGNDPLDNPLFHEEYISKPSANNIFREHNPILAEKFNPDSSVYRDVMENIKQNTAQNNKKILADFGVSDNYGMGSVSLLTIKAKTENALNSHERYLNDYEPDKSAEIVLRHSERTPLLEYKPLKGSLEVPILDISKFIPKLYAYQSQTPTFETDFIPMTPSFIRAESSIQENTTPLPATTKKKDFLETVPNGSIRNAQNNFHKLNRAPSNVVVFRRRRPIAIIRVVPRII